MDHIVTGHTIVANTVTVHYGGKLFNTDVEHAGGHLEALLMDGHGFYRVLPTGETLTL